MSKAYKNIEINTVKCMSKLTKLVTLLKEQIKATRHYQQYACLIEAQCERIAFINYNLHLASCLSLGYIYKHDWHVWEKLVVRNFEVVSLSVAQLLQEWLFKSSKPWLYNFEIVSFFTIPKHYIVFFFIMQRRSATKGNARQTFCTLNLRPHECAILTSKKCAHKMQETRYIQS